MIKIYLNYFSPARTVSNEMLSPIQVGKGISDFDLNMTGDDTGNNISSKNPAFCELTGIYWAWKNDLKSDVLGFMHYRRFLDFYPTVDRANDTIHGVMVEKFDEDFLEDFGLTDSRAEELFSEYDAMIPRPLDVSHFGQKSVEHQYKNSHHHHIKDFRLAEQIVSELYPDDKIYFRRTAKGKTLYPCNIFIFKRSLFLEYCEWIFPILFELDKRIDTTGYTTQAKRAVGFLAERLFTTFILKKRSESTDIKFNELRMVIVKETSPAPVGPKKPVTNLPVTSIVASSDQAYLPHLSALIHSVFDNANKKSFLDFIVLDGGVSADEKRLISRIPETYGQEGRITFVDMSRQFLSTETHSYFTRSTFYRLMLPDLLNDYERILFIDTDMIVLADLSDLFNLNLKGKAIAAVEDLVMRTFTSRGVLSIKEAGGKPASVYLHDHLGMGKRYREYFQAGTILFDLRKMREKNYAETCIRDLLDNRYWFLDQDVLNKNLLGDVLFIDNKWNSLFLDDNSLGYLNSKEAAIFTESTKTPYIIHFAGQFKPWINDQHPLGHHYWFYLRRTHWYESVLGKYLSKSASLTPVASSKQSAFQGNPSFKWRFFRRGWLMLPSSIQRSILPFATKFSQAIR